MFYTIYKTTNKINGKFYIGKHKTKDLNDNYMGSGKQLKYAIKKYGIDNFEKEILYVFSDEQEMNDKEAELVTEDFVKQNDNYNLCIGGKGGWGYINSNGLSPINNGSDSHIERSKRASIIGNEKLKELRKDESWVQNNISKQTISARKKLLADGKHWSKGKIKHTEEWKQRQSSIMKEKSKGEKNSQYGKIWITDGIVNKKIHSTDTIPEGFKRGRTLTK